HTRWPRDWSSDVCSSDLVDIGGGSTEIVLSTGGMIEQIYSLPLGAVRLTEEFGEIDPADIETFDKMRRSVRRLLRQAIGQTPFEIGRASCRESVAVSAVG